MAGLVSVISILEKPAAELTCVEGMCVALYCKFFAILGLWALCYYLTA